MPSLLRPPSLGPIVGHTTENSVRLWMRGATVSPGRTIGVAVLARAGGEPIAGEARYFRLHREYDRTGTVDYSGLTPNTRYLAKLGSLSLDSVDDAAMVDDDDLLKRLPPAEAWIGDLTTLPNARSTAEFTTHPAGELDSLSFIFGSCRYPGLLRASKRSDEAFGSILEQAQGALGNPIPRFVLMIGDQIYADKMHRVVPIARADTVSEFHERYNTAFSSPRMRALLRQLPSYMILDDHEIEDNWVQGRLRDREKRDIFQMAISAYLSYQWLHSPRNYDAAGEVFDGTGRKLYYSFRCGGYPFFVLDSRTQRIRDDRDNVLEDNHLLGHPRKSAHSDLKGQVDLLCEWLVKQQAELHSRPKFIVSPSVFVPNVARTAGNDARARRYKCEDDSWAAFPETRRQILRTIVRNSVENVVFLCGDVHCANTAEMRFVHATEGTLPLRAFCITSSAFYWPWAFADGDPLSFVHHSTKEKDDFEIDERITMTYTASDFEQEDNFTRVDVTPKSVTAHVFSRDNRPLGKPRVFELTGA